MEPASGATSRASQLVAEAAELEYQCLVAERAHDDGAWWAWQRYKVLGLGAALLGALTTGSALEVVGQLELAPDRRAAITGVLAMVLTITTTALNFLDPKGQRDRHDAISKKLAALRAEVRLFRRVDLGDAGADAADPKREEELERLLSRHAELVVDAPALNDRRHRAAKRELASNVFYRELRALTGRTGP